jgi:hypothetical protein
VDEGKVENCLEWIHFSCQSSLKDTIQFW